MITSTLITFATSRKFPGVDLIIPVSTGHVRFCDWYMAYYVEDLLTTPVFGPRRPTVNEYFLSSYTLSIYDGCEFGCPYCDGWAYRLRPFNEMVRVALNLPDRIAEELQSIDRGDLIGITALSDAYQQVEGTYRLTRQVLRVLADRGQPCLILTKSPAVLEDLVLLERIHEQSLAVVMFTLLTIDPYLATKIEDKAPAPQLRLEAIAELKRAGIPVGVALMPIIPYVNDTTYMLTSTIRAVTKAGADFIVWDYLSIPNVRHRARIGDMLSRIGNYPPSYYRELYGEASKGKPSPDPIYLNERDREILGFCDAHNLPVRMPHHLFAGRIKPQNEAALLLKHIAFRDSVQGRVYMAAHSRKLAELIYSGQASESDLRDSPLYLALRDILIPPSGEIASAQS